MNIAVAVVNGSSEDDEEKIAPVSVKMPVWQPMPRDNRVGVWKRPIKKLLKMLWVWEMADQRGAGRMFFVKTFY